MSISTFENESGDVAVTFLSYQLIQWEQKSHHQFAQTAEWERQSVKCGTTEDHQTNDQCVGEETSAHTLQVQRNISLLKRVHTTTMTDTYTSKSSLEMSQCHCPDVCPPCVRAHDYRIGQLINTQGRNVIMMIQQNQTCSPFIFLSPKNESYTNG